MSISQHDILEQLRAEIVTLLPRKSHVTSVGDDDALITSGLLDSVSAMKLVTFLEQSFEIELEPEELSAARLDTPRRIAELVASKKTMS